MGLGEAACPPPFCGRLRQLVQRGVLELLRQVVPVEQLGAQVLTEGFSREPVVQADGQVLRDVGQVVALVRRQWEMVLAGPSRGDLLAGSEQEVGQAGTQDRGAAALADVRQQGGPLFERIGEPGRVPHPPALEAHEEHRHPPVRTLAYRPARDGHGAVDLSVATQLPEEGRQEQFQRGHGEPAVHRDHGWDAGLCQAWAECGQRALHIAWQPIAAAGALTGGQHHEPRRLA